MITFKLYSGSVLNNHQVIKNKWEYVTPSEITHPFVNVPAVNILQDQCGYTTKNRYLWNYKTYTTNLNLKLKFITTIFNNAYLTKLLKGTILLDDTAPFIEVTTPFGKIFEGSGRLFIPKSAIPFVTKEVKSTKTKSKKLILKKDEI